MPNRLAAVALLVLTAALGASSALANKNYIPEQPPCRAGEAGFQCYGRIMADRAHPLHAKFLLLRQNWCRFYGMLDLGGDQSIAELCRPAGIDVESDGVKLDAAATDEQGVVELVERGRLAQAADIDLINALGCKVEPTQLGALGKIEPTMPIGAPICWELNYQMDCYGNTTRSVKNRHLGFRRKQQ